MRKEVVFGLLFIGIFMVLVVDNSSAATVNVTACGQALNVSGNTYLLNNSINSTITCLTIGANNLVLDGGGLLLNFSGGSLTYGIDNDAGDYSNITVKNFIIEQGNASTSSAIPIYTGSGTNWTIINNTILTRGSSCDAIFVNAFSRNISVLSNKIVNIKSSSRGIVIYISNYHTATNNNITIINSSTAIETISSSNNTFINNSILVNSTNYGSGITVRSGTGNIFINNSMILRGNGSRGFELLESSPYNIFQYNTINITSNGSAIGVSTNSIGNNFTMNTILSASIDLSFLGQDANLTRLINQKIRNYSFEYSENAPIIENTSFGVVAFLSVLNGTGTDLFGTSNSDVFFGNNSFILNATTNPEVNRSANVTLYGVGSGFANPTVYKNGNVCSECYVFTSNGNITFNISMQGIYSIGEAPVVQSTSSGGGSSSPTNGGGIYYPTGYLINGSNLTDGFSAILLARDYFKFNLNNADHTVTLNKFNSSAAEVTIQSNPIEAILIQGIKKEVDIDHDGIVDIALVYVGFYNGKGILHFRLENGKVQESPEINQSIEQEAAILEEKSKNQIFIFIGLIAVVLIVFVWLRNRNYKILSTTQKSL